MAEIPEVAEALVIQSGDTLIIRVDRRATPDEARQVADHVKQRCPDVTVLVVAAEQLAVVRG